MKTQFLCTLGPSSLNERVIKRLAELGTSLFRLNLSHTKVKDAARIIDFVQKMTRVPLSLDTEGAQIRTGELVDGKIALRENCVVRVHRRRVPGDSLDFNLYPPRIIDEFVVGDFLHIDADVLIQVIDVGEDVAHMRVLSGGVISQNKAVTVERDIRMPPLTEKDRKILAIGRELEVGHVALSFANSASDVDIIRAATGPGVHVISKIECRAGLANLEEIARASDAILIDRGDLSREVPLEQIPAAQKHIIRCAHEVGRKVYVATNLMESMTTSPVPTRAEVSDVFNTLMDGADGLVLAGETAIGRYPIGCASMIKTIATEYERALAQPFSSTPAPSISLLIDPHAGPLVQRTVRREEIGDLANRCDVTITVDEQTLQDCEQIGVGAYSPLCGFMTRDDLESVLDRYRLPGGAAWTLPILLPLEAAAAHGVEPGARLGLCDAEGAVGGIVDVTEVFTVDPTELIRRWFGTTESMHPSALRVFASGGTFVAGNVTLGRPYSDPLRQYVLTPSQARLVFAKKGWTRVVAFRTRNVPHRGHEHVQRTALVETRADGLFINPVIGTSTGAGFLPAAVLESYQALLEFGRYPTGRVVLGATAAQAGSATVREAVFHAICSRNYGCSHHVFGPEFSRPEPAQTREAIRVLFEQLGDLDVHPVFFDEIGYDPHTGTYGRRSSDSVHPLRSSAVRDAFQKHEELPTWFVHEIVQERLHDEIVAGRPVFHPKASSSRLR